MLHGAAGKYNQKKRSSSGSGGSTGRLGVGGCGGDGVAVGGAFWRSAAIVE